MYYKKLANGQIISHGLWAVCREPEARPQAHSPRLTAQSSFTYIEVLITLAMLGILFVPMMQLFSYGLSSPAVSGDAITACHLARWEMEKVKNLNLTTAQLKKQGDLWMPSLEQPPLEINQKKWRVLRHINPASDPLEVYVEVFSADNLRKPLASLVTLIGDNIWTQEETL